MSSVTLEVSREAAVRDLARNIFDKIAIPKDQWEIAAQLEVLGMRDLDAEEEFGERDLFALASRIYGMYRTGQVRVVPWKPPPEKVTNALAQFVKSYGDGLVFALPMALQMITMMIWGVSLWGGIDLDMRMGSAVALGFFGSYAVTGGFSQAIVRRGLFYFYQEEDFLARRVVVQMWIIAIAVVAGLLVAALGVNAAFQYLPWDMLSMAAIYYVTLSVLWLNFSLLYLVQRNSNFTFLVAIGLLLVIFLRSELNLSVVAANGIALVVLDLASFAIAWVTLTSRAKKRGVTRIASAPRLPILVYGVALYFGYGVLYQLMLFADRLIAWTGVKGRGDFLPYPFWFDPAYELGMALALMVVVLLMGVVEHAAQRFSLQLIPAQKNLPSIQAHEFNRRFERFYWRQIAFYAVAGVLAVAGTYAMVILMSQMPVFAILSRVFLPVSHRVFWAGSIAYVFFMGALLNVLILLSLSRVDLAIRGLLWSVVCNVVIGFLCSRIFHYAASVTGLLVGSIVFAIYTTFTVRGVLRRLDYYYYAAY